MRWGANVRMRSNFVASQPPPGPFLACAAPRGTMKFFGKAFKVFASQTHIEKDQKVIRGDSVVELALRTQVHLVFPTSRALISS